MGGQSPSRGKSSTRGTAGARPANRPLAVEPLEPRHLMAVTVFLDFGGISGENSFAARLTELTQAQGRQAPQPAELAALQTTISSAVQSAFSGFDVSVTQDLPAGEFETLSFGRTKDFVFDAPEGFGQADLDWLNINHFTNDGEATAYVFPAEFNVPDLSGLARPAYLTRLGNALAYWGIHELGHAFGLENQDAFGDPSVMPETYGNTFGVQNRNFMAVPSFGLSFTQFDSLAGFTFSPLSRVKLQMAEGLTAAAVPSVQETVADHNTPATAQQLNLVPFPLASAQGINVELGSASEEADVYKFDAQAGDLLTINTIATDVYEHVFDVSESFTFDTVVRLIAPDGTTVVMTSDDIFAGVNKLGNIAGTSLVDQDSLIVNYRVPAGSGGTYYVEVTSKTQASGFYDLLIAKWTPTLRPWQNPVGDARDVTRDGEIVARDALRVINEINRVGSGGRRLPNPTVGADNPVVVSGNTTEYYYFDVNGDDFVTAIDALSIINRLNNPPGGEGGEGEASLASNGESAAALSPAAPSRAALSPAAVDASFAAILWWGLDELDAVARGRKK